MKYLLYRMARITGKIEDKTLQRLRHYLIDKKGSTRFMGEVLDDLINKALDVEGYPEVVQ